MAPLIPTTEPEIVRSGETLSWTKSLADFPASEYTLKYYLTGPASISITCTAYNVTDHLASQTAAQTILYTYGIYQWEAYAEKGAGPTAEKYFVESGFLTVKTAAGKSFAKTMLDAIEAILTGRGTNKDYDLVGKSLGGSSLSRDPKILEEARMRYKSEYAAEVANENRAQGKASGSRVLMRFTKPT